MTIRRSLCILLVLCLLFGGCASHEAPPLTRQTLALDTTCTLTLYGTEDQTILDACVAHLTAREAIWSKTADGSDIKRLNEAGGVSKTVDPATAKLLTQALSFAEATDGAFDVTVAPLVDTWAAAEKSGTLPDAMTLHSTVALVGADHITVDGDTVTLTGGTSLDLGGIAKGQIADELAALILEKGCQSAIVDLGGNIVAVGKKQDGTPFHVGIADPLRENALAATVAVSDTAVVTSGSYERGYTIDGKHYSHIIDPRTGQPVDNELASVTILAPTAVKADALSTACFVVGYDQALVILAQYDKTEAVFVFRDGTVKATDGVEFV